MAASALPDAVPHTVGLDALLDFDIDTSLIEDITQFALSMWMKDINPDGSASLPTNETASPEIDLLRSSSRDAANVASSAGQYNHLAEGLGYQDSALRARQARLLGLTASPPVAD
jgi:hypothetical protein